MSLVFPVPPVVSQKGALNPDGSPDPAGSTDCGEACLSSAWRGIRDFLVSPGCVREGMALPATNGRSTGAELAQACFRAGFKAAYLESGAGGLWKPFQRLRHSGRYAVVLADWLAPGVAHWQLAYERDALSVFSMDPWDAQYRTTHRDALEALNVQGAVFIG